eukprot:TRINITY_DN19150_c0_g1_i1.p1 TRINITY_DN19150_c0_g1~~TRINITY_DN19150_c0_g1_i1.p1  ORF type:complete len:204 (+),score=35.78 TRINITY_DN19150_c0_g1_i1:60-614(+)
MTSPNDYFNITSDKLMADDLIQKVTLPSCGAVTTFCGTTRDNFEGKDVVELVYESYDEMAYKEMKRIATEIRKKWPDVGGIAISHRTGVVPVCESSVVIAVSSPHRGTSIEAVHFAINTLKKSVPIWKKEIYADGAPDWKRNTEFLNSELMKRQTSGLSAMKTLGIVILAAAPLFPLFLKRGRN